MKKLLTSLAAFGLVLVTGCATIVGDKTQLMGISSTPDKANIKIVDERGQDVYEGITPTTVTLQKGDGTYFGGKTYTVTISKDGFNSSVVTVTHNANGWYIFGNLIFGGLIGWFIVDPLTGAMYTLNPQSVSASLSANPTAPAAPAAGQKTGYEYKNGELHVALLQDIPAAMRDQLVPVSVPASHQ